MNKHPAIGRFVAVEEPEHELKNAMKRKKTTTSNVAAAVFLLGGLSGSLQGATVEVGDGLDTAAELSLGFTLTSNRGAGSQPTASVTTGITDNIVGDALYDGINLESGLTTVDSGAEIIFGFYGSETYDPTVGGAILSIDYNVYASEIGVGDGPIVPILRQGGVDYVYVGSGVSAGDTNAGFRPGDGNADDGGFLNMTLNATASDFLTIDLADMTFNTGGSSFLVPPSTAGSPDFSAAGGEIEFGWAVGAGTSGTSNTRNVRILTTGDQTTSVAINVVPEPSAALLGGLGILGLLRRRRTS